MLETGVEMPAAYLISICDPDCRVETYTELVADGQTALRVQSEYVDIYIYTDMPRAAVCPCVSLAKWGDRAP